MTFDIVAYGADPTGKLSSRAAIQTAIDACAAAGGGIVSVPAGKFVSGTVYFRSNVELHLSCGAALVEDTDFSEYCTADAYPENFDCPSEKWVGAHLLVARECENIALTGCGKICGRADIYYSGELHFGSYTGYWQQGYHVDGKEQPVRLGQMIHFVKCKNVRVSDVTLSDASGWNLYLLGCEDVTVRGITVRAGKTHANTDGIDVDCCRYVRVSDCLFDNGDDCIAIRADNERFGDGELHPCEYITVTGCVLSDSACAVRLGVGDGVIRFVTIADCVMARSGEGISFMTGFNGSGHVDVSDVSLHNIIGDEVGCPLQLFADTGSVRRVTVDGLDSGCLGRVSLRGEAGRISEITLRHLRIRDRSDEWKNKKGARKERAGAIFSAENVSGLVFDDALVVYREGCEEDTLGCALKNTEVSGTLKGSKTVC